MEKTTKNETLENGRLRRSRNKTRWRRESMASPQCGETGIFNLEKKICSMKCGEADKYEILQEGRFRRLCNKIRRRELIGSPKCGGEKNF